MKPTVKQLIRWALAASIVLIFGIMLLRLDVSDVHQREIALLLLGVLGGSIGTVFSFYFTDTDKG
jgi:hypothetical protein